MKFGNCSECGLRHQKEKGQHCGPARPTKPFNGIMIIGEGPGHYEVAKNTPFVGPAGRYLTAFLEYAGIDRDACYITNATLCLPRIKDKSSLHKSFPTAIPACLSRLEEEIEEVQPRLLSLWVLQH